MTATDPAVENPNSARHVNATLTAVTSPAPSFLVRRSDIRLETIVPAQITIVMTPAIGSGASSSARTTGHAEPSRESGRPRLMNDKYIIGSKNESIGDLSVMSIGIL